MTKKIDKRKSGIITGPALRSVSMIVGERTTSGTKGGVAVCADREGALASAANSRNRFFIPKIG
jgi:hypothetical protein